MMPADGLLNTMEEGIMEAQASVLNAAERRAVAEYLAGVSLDTVVARAAAPMCMGPARAFDLRRPPAKAGWGVSRENQRHIPAEVAGLAASDLPKLKLKWAFAFPDAQRMRSQPTVAMGAVFIGSQDGTVYALDKESGCVRWTFRASAEVRSPVTLEGWDVGSPPQRPLAYFADLIARVYAVDAQTGELVWSAKVDDHPNATVTGAPVLYQGRLFVPDTSPADTYTPKLNDSVSSVQDTAPTLNARDGERHHAGAGGRPRRR